MPRIMIVEDEECIVSAVEKTLASAGGFALTAVRDPAKALPAAISGKPDLILLDIRLPGSDGRHILKALKENAATRPIPVIFLTGMSGEGDKVIGLDMGADDYVVKPFGAMELLARIHAVLRRTRPRGARPTAASSLDAVSVGGLKLDASSRSASFRGKPLRLQPKEFEILFLLASRPGRAHARGWLIDNTSSYGMSVATRSLDTHIKNIRRKLGRARRLIETVPKIGYRFVRPHDRF
ncbi:MAG: response regulator transcription factor [Elusimicrobia bacterium]|nr:response regulator transcription factor [Elusimicrobiota bacterium]